MPGDDIIGFITRGRGVSVHRRDCPNISPQSLSEEDMNRLIGVSWETSKPAGEFLSDLQVEADDRTGLLAEITVAITETKAPIRAFNARTAKGNVAIVNVTVEITSTNQLEAIMKKIRNLKGVYDVTRCTQ